MQVHIEDCIIERFVCSALARLLAQVSRIAAASPDLQSADMNPVLALEEGAVILDALLIPASAPPA